MQALDNLRKLARPNGLYGLINWTAYTNLRLTGERLTAEDVQRISEAK
jgi:hypothetical protein